MRSRAVPTTATGALAMSPAAMAATPSLLEALVRGPRAFFRALIALSSQPSPCSCPSIRYPSARLLVHVLAHPP
eukprot:1628141-Alexandrium_andersonii.AAC.1